jgi:hypothetical protein
MQFRRFLFGGPYDKEMVPWEEYRYVAFARRFGWTPEQVDKIPLRVEGWIWPMMSALDEWEEKEQERRQRDQERRAKKFGRRK